MNALTQGEIEIRDLLGEFMVNNDEQFNKYLGWYNGLRGHYSEAEAVFYRAIREIFELTGEREGARDYVQSEGDR